MQSAYVILQGGQGGQSVIAQTGNGGAALPIGATLSLGGGVTELQIVVGGQGQYSNPGSGAGGFNGGGSGGAGSLTGQQGAGGGGATTVYVTAGSTPNPTPVMVAGGGGGGGGFRNNNFGSGGSSGSTLPGSNGVWPAGDGTAAGGDNGGAGGGGGTQPGGIGTAGGNAEDVSGNGGGGGGGGGWYGGAGGQPGQAGAVFGTAGGGGGGGGGSSYTDPLLTSNPSSASLPDLSITNGAAQVNWVDILTTALKPLRAGRAIDQQLTAVYGLSWPVTWQVTAGVIPEGLALSATGELTGTPTRSGSYSFEATVAPEPDVFQQAASVITYSGAVCARRCGRNGRT